MRLANVISGSTFRLALKSLAFFVLMLVIVGYCLVNALTLTLENQTRAQLEEEAILFNDIYQAQGRKGLVSSIKMLSQRSAIFNRELGVFDENKLHLGGSISLIPRFIKWHRTTLSLSNSNVQQQYHAKVFSVNKLTLVVGRSTAGIDALTKQLVYWLIGIGMTLSMGILLLGYFASARSYRKLSDMSDVLRTIAKGDISARILIEENSDQIDAIGQQMNEHLEHLAKLIGGIQSTATAIAHDLKTPLSHAQIALYEAQELIEQANCPKQKIEAAQDKLAQLNQTFDTILRISRIQVHTDRSQFKPENLSLLIHNVIELLEPIAQERSIILHVEPVKEDMQSLNCDRGMIQQLLINLINNALIHCPANSSISVNTHWHEKSVQIVVEDNGPGIPDSAKEEILQPFTRLSQSRTTQGNGLGLALVKAIVDQHGASIDLQNSEPGLRVIIHFDIS